MDVLHYMQRIIRPLFGEFEKEEFKKFLCMGAIFALIIGSFWTIGTLRNALFVMCVGITHVPYAKTVSLICLIPALLMYTRLLDRYSRETVLYMFSLGSGILVFIFGCLFAYTQEMVFSQLSGPLAYVPYVIGYSFFIFVECYGLLMTSLFWSTATDITLPESAKKGFPFIVAIGQLGGIIGPYTINSLPRRMGLSTSALSLFVVSGAIVCLLFFIRKLFKKTPPSLMVSYHGKNEEQAEQSQKAGFFEGLRLLLQHSYLRGIAAIIIFPEIITTIFDLHFHSLAAQQYSGVHLVEYFGAHGSVVNIMTFLFLMCGISSITRVLGLGISLILMPIMYGAAIGGFITLSSLTFLFFLMASSKAINYALNGPAIKQLYIPTTQTVRFKSQAWIDTFGSRGAREVGALFNMLLGPLQKNLGDIAGRAQHALLASYFGSAIVIVWFFVALFLGKKYRSALAEKKVVC